MSPTKFADMVKNQKYEKQKKHTTENGKYFISTNLTWDRGWETMVFRRDPLTEDIDWSEVDSDLYNDEKEAYVGHDVMVSKWEAKD